MRLLPVILLLSISYQLFAQGEIDTQDKTFWRNERAFGASAFSDGWGIDYREVRQTKPDIRLFIEAGLGVYKDPKEVKIQNYYFYSPYSFVYGKINSNWHLYAGFGYLHEIFEKQDLGGVSIGWFVGGGPVLTFCKPIYYKVIVPLTSTTFTYKEEKFDLTSMLASDIYGKASFFKGFDEIKLFPGLYAHGGFNFEYSHNDKLTQSLEIGTSISGYLKEIPVMANEHNKQVFFSLYVSYKIGIILDPLKMQNDFLTSVFSRKKE